MTIPSTHLVIGVDIPVIGEDHRDMRIEAQHLGIGDQFLIGRTVYTVTDAIRHETLVELTTTRFIAGRGYVASVHWVPFERIYTLEV